MGTIRESRLDLAGHATRALELEAGARRPGPALILLHGYSDSADTWRPLLSRLERAGRGALAVDLPGFGEATRLERDGEILPQLDRFVAAAVGREAERSPSGEVIVAGNSLGGCVALRAAQDASLPIAAVVPIAPAGLEMARWFSIIETAPLVRLLLRAPVPLPEAIVRDAVGRVYRSVAFSRPRELDPAVVAAFTRHLRSRRDVVRILATGRRLLPELVDPFELGRISCPVLLVWGERDRMVFSSGAERVLRDVPGSRIKVIEHCGHCPQIESPDRLVDLLLELPAALSAAA